MPLSPGVQQNPNVVSTLSPTDPYGLGGLYAALQYDPNAEPGIEYGDVDVTQRKAAGVAPSGMTEMYVPGVGLTMVPNEKLSDQQATLAWTPGNPVYDNSQRFFATGDTAPTAHHADTFIPGQQYRLIDQTTGEVLGTANDLASFQQLASKASQIAAPALQNKAVPMTTLQRAAAGDNPQWSDQTGFNYVPANGLNDFLRIAGPMLGATFLPGVGFLGLGGLGATGAAAAGAALGSVGAGALTGQDIGDILKSAALSGGLTFAGGSLLGGAGSGAGDVGRAASNMGAGASGFGSTASGLDALGQIVVNGAPALAGGIGGALGNLAGSALGGALQSAPSVAEPNQIVVNGYKPPVPSLSVPGSVPFNGSDLPGSTPPATEPGQIVVNGQQQPSVSPGDVALGAGVLGAGTLAAGGGGSGATAGLGPDGEIVVTSPTPPAATGISGTTVGAGILGAGALGAAAAGGSGAASTAAAAPKSTLDKIVDALTAAGLGTQLLGSVLGGGSGGSGGYLNSLGNGNLNSVFSKTLPSGPTAIGGGTSNLSARAMPQQDWTKYAMRPEQSFFNNVPSTYTPPPPGQTDQWTHLAEGGLAARGHPRKASFAVNGPGTGRSDHVPAMLSDGEYVVDAETVALLGDGSNKAGADKLDAFRVNLRKHKGRQLAKGKFSLSAKAPEAYMAGGRK